jgi:hypothetical protein
MSTPNLPIRYEIENDGNGGAAELEHICSSVESEGGMNKNGVLRHADANKNNYATAGTRYLVMAGRLKSTHLGASIDIENVSTIIYSNDFGHWELIVGGTPSAALTFNDLVNSAVQIALGDGTITHSNGMAMDGGYISTQQSIVFNTPNAARPGSLIDGTPQVWYLIFIPFTNNTNMGASITWRELS